jgi:hypothetical protein
MPNFTYVRFAKPTVLFSLHESREKASNIDTTVRSLARWRFPASPRGQFSGVDAGKKRLMAEKGHSRPGCQRQVRHGPLCRRKRKCSQHCRSRKASSRSCPGVGEERNDRNRRHVVSARTQRAEDNQLLVPESQKPSASSPIPKASRASRWWRTIPSASVSIVPDGQITSTCFKLKLSSPAAKNIPLNPSGKSALSTRPSHPTRGALRTSRTRGEMRWT